MAQERGLGDSQVDFVAALAERASVSPLDVLKHLAVFERATARELARPAHDPDLDQDAMVKQIGALRVALGFHVLSPDHWLLSTRELKPGDQAKLGPGQVAVAEVTETHWSIVDETPGARAGATGPLTLEVIRPHDARYLVHCQALGPEQVDGQARLRLRHDEHPERLQQREYVRVRVNRPLSWVTRAPGRKEPAPSVEGQIVDVSAGGISFDSPRSEAQGALLVCSFELAEQLVFKDATIVVIDATAAREQGGFRVRAAFTGLSSVERDRLAAAVAWHERQQAARLAVT